MFSIAMASGLILYALRQNIDLYFTPEQLLAANPRPMNRVRIGGMVKDGSIKRNNDLSLSFIVTDYKCDLQVVYNGILPDLFKSSQGVVALGHLNADQVFVADQILAKHDENYMPGLSHAT